MLGEALSYPRRGDGWLKRIGIGGLLYILSFLVIPVFILQGYFLRVLGSAAREEGSAPAFEDWGGLLVDGLKLVVVSIAYLIVPYAVLFAGGALLGSGGGNPSVVGLVLTLLGFLLTLVAAFVLPVAQTNLALEGRVGAAFDFGRVFGAAFSGRYVIAVILAVVVGGILSIIAGLLSILIVGIFLLFYVQVFIFYLYGTGCGPKLVEEVDPTQSATDPIEY